MKIAIISDIHNNLVNLKKVLNFCAKNKIKTIICCGDLANIESLDFLNSNFSGEIYHTFGNMDEGQMQDDLTWTSNVQVYKNTTIYKNFGEIEIEKKHVAFVHYPEMAKKLGESGKYDFVFYGHTHKPWVFSVETTADQRLKKCILLNPGNVGNQLYLPTFAVWETENDKFDLIRVNELK